MDIRGTKAMLDRKQYKEAGTASFGQRLKELRKSKGLSQQEVSNLFKVSRPCVCYWETGKRAPDYQALIELGNFYNVSIDYLLGLSNNRKLRVRDSFKNYRADDYIDISKLGEEEKRSIRDYYEYLLSKQGGHI